VNDDVVVRLVEVGWSVAWSVEGANVSRLPLFRRTMDMGMTCKRLMVSGCDRLNDSKWFDTPSQRIGL
jgi:hypothetical protein